MEVVQLEHVVRAAGAVAVRRPPSDAENHAQGTGPGARVRRTAAAEETAAAQVRQRADQTLQVVVQPVPDPRVRPFQPVHAAAEEPLSPNQTVQLAVVFPAQHFDERVIFRLFSLFPCDFPALFFFSA